MQGDDCWSGRDKQIKGNRQNTGVRDDTYKQFVSVSTTKSRDQLIVEYNDKLREFTPKQSIDRQVRNILKEYPRAHIVKEVYTGMKF